MAGKNKTEGINSQLALVMKSGKTSLGFKNVLKILRKGKVKAIIMANNLPLLRKSQLNYLAVLSKVKVIEYTGTNTELGTACGKLFRISTLAILNPGDSDILENA